MKSKVEAWCFVRFRLVGSGAAAHRPPPHLVIPALLHSGRANYPGTHDGCRS